MRGVVFRDVVWGVVIVFVFLLAYYVLYLLSFIYLRPYINYYLSIINSIIKGVHVRVFNLAMLIIFLSSPFNAYEAKILHTNPTTYFMLSVIAPTLLMYIPLTLYNYAMVRLRVRPIIRPINFTIFAIAASLLDSWIVSLIIWIALGAPSIGTSIYSVFQFTATAYILLIIITQAIRVMITQIIRVKYLARIKPKFKPLLSLILAALLITAIIMGALAYAIYRIFTEYVPLSNINHAMGLMIALISIGVYHVSKTTTLSLKVNKPGG